jgi:uncharacterized membrane protein (UPF0182 family)
VAAIAGQTRAVLVVSAAQAVTVRYRRWHASARGVSLWRTPRARSLLLLATVGGFGGLVWFGAHAYTDLLWFEELGQERVFWTTLMWKLLAQGLVGLGTAALLLVNLAVVDRVTDVRAVPPEDRSRLARLWPYRRLLFPAVAIAGGVLSSRWLGDGAWQRLALWANRSDFGIADPLLHRDVGFFVFSLPLYQQAARWLLGTLAMATVATIVAYVAAGEIRSSRSRIVVGRAARAHLLVLAAVALLLTAWRYRLDQFALAVQHDDSKVPGGGYIDAHVRLPLLRSLMVVSLAGGVLCLYAARRRVPRLPLAAVAVLGVVAVAGQSALPPLIDRFAVAPQELTSEKPYLSDAIAFTRRAFELDRIDVRPLPGSGTVSAAAIAANRRTLDNVPLWDPGVLRPAINELQSIGDYYGFPSTTVDRYPIRGRPQLLTVAARQLDRGRLDTVARGWANDRFAYTHGYGAVAVQAGGTDASRRPRFAQGQFGSARNPLRLREPRIYFDEQPDSDPPYVVLDSSRGEIDAPVSGSRHPGYHYDGSGGIPLSNPFRRIAFAARFGDLNLLLTDTVSDDSRIVLHREVGERLRTLSPFLRWDSRPQTTVVGGRVTFVFHGYTTSSDYPYSARVRFGNDRVSYVQAAASATVDAFSGRVRIYAAEPGEDPILRAWRAVYPSLILPPSQMPRELRTHLRYPRELFAAQARAYATYHADDPTGFWNGADDWQRALQLAGPAERAGDLQFPDPDRSAEMRPEYLFARLPGQARERLLLVMPFTPSGRQNLAAYLAGWIDDRGRPRLSLLSFPRDRLTLGPTQATRQILATPGVNRRLQLLNRESRDLGKAAVDRTILGAPRLLPVGTALVYVQPIYLAAGGSGVPRLQLVTALANGRVGYGRDVEAALRATLSR